MRSILIALIAALCALPASAAEQAPAPKEMVLLTVSGTIGESNRGALDPTNNNIARSRELKRASGDSPSDTKSTKDPSSPKTSSTRTT